MKNIVLFVISLLMLVVFAAGCTQKEAGADASKGVDITIGPENGAAEETPAAAAGEAEGAAEAPPEKTENKTVSAGTPAKLSESDLPEITCDESETIGFVKCAKQASGDSELTIKNSGREDLAGVYIKYYKGSGVAGSKSEMSEFSVGNYSTVPLEVKKYAADKIEVFPVWSGSICINKQILIKPSDNCR